MSERIMEDIEPTPEITEAVGLTLYEVQQSATNTVNDNASINERDKYVQQQPRIGHL